MFSASIWLTPHPPSPVSCLGMFYLIAANVGLWWHAFQTSQQGSALLVCCVLCAPHASHDERGKSQHEKNTPGRHCSRPVLLLAKDDVH